MEKWDIIFLRCIVFFKSKLNFSIMQKIKDIFLIVISIAFLVMLGIVIFRQPKVVIDKRPELIRQIDSLKDITEVLHKDYIELIKENTFLADSIVSLQDSIKNRKPIIKILKQQKDDKKNMLVPVIPDGSHDSLFTKLITGHD